MQEKILFPNEIILKTKFWRIEQDWEVPLVGFFILVPLRTLQSIDELSDEEAVDFINLLRKLRKGMREILKIKEVYLFENEDTLHNFHLWIFPRHNWMEKFGKKIESVRPIINYTKENMTNKENFKEIKNAIEEMREYMNFNKNN
ncbi:diadenosine tetraphosphate hydrolase [Candidatus Gracilibacteria bacterium]|nr:diadenosine tetraphosphate hydrolase [Candidatus Gracilibacteria bacterium]NUJ99093.1 diadenosine tetraphosphate hydrolase [Candidatus Gracilibacteria bacterium]